jgi:hypothetical protein
MSKLRRASRRVQAFDVAQDAERVLEILRQRDLLLHVGHELHPVTADVRRHELAVREALDDAPQERLGFLIESLEFHARSSGGRWKVALNEDGSSRTRAACVRAARAPRFAARARCP